MNNVSHPTNIGPYPVIKEIARGGQGIVFLARHPQLTNKVAIKVMLDPTPETVSRFKQEARILAKIRHPHLLHVVDYGLANNFPYMVMEYIEGLDLKGYLQQGQPPLSQIIEIIKTIAHALSYLHQYGLVHRDIKPGNILIERMTLRPVLADLGLAKRSDPSKLSMGSIAPRLSHSGEVMGTPAFMAPEQVSSELGEIGPWTDVYGLGATLFQILTGRAVYTGTSPINVLVKIQNNNPPPHPRDINPEIPEYLDEAIWAAIQKPTSARPQSMEEWVAMLKPKTKVPVKRSRKWIPIVGTTLGFSGLVAYFLSLGATPQEAKQLAKQELKSSSSLISSPTPTAATITTKVLPDRSLSSDLELQQKAEQATQLFQSGDLDASLAIINELLDERPQEYNCYWIRSKIYWAIADRLLEKGKLVEGKVMLRKCLQDIIMMADYLPPEASLQDIQSTNELRRNIEARIIAVENQILSGHRRCLRHNPFLASYISR